MTEFEAMQKTTPRMRGLVLTTIAIWVISLGGTWVLTRGDYYRTFPSAWWFWALAFVVCWSIAAYWSLDSNIDGPKLEEVPEHKLRLSRREPRRSLPAGPTLEEIDSRRHTVLGQYGAFLSDIMAIVDAPLLADPTCPATDRFQESLVVAEDGHTSAVRDSERLPEYAEAVTQLEKRWAEALSYARRKGASTLDPAEQDAVRRAKNLLEVALDENAFAPERRAAMHKAVALLRTVIDLPDQATAAIDHRVQRLELEG